MENENLESAENHFSFKKQITTVTIFSKYLALLLFIVLPFIGGYIGYKFSPEKTVVIEKIVVMEKVVDIENKITQGTLDDTPIQTGDSVSESSVIKHVVCNPKNFANESVMDCESDMTEVDTARETNALEIYKKTTNANSYGVHMTVSHNRYVVLNLQIGPFLGLAVVDLEEKILVGETKIRGGALIENNSKVISYINDFDGMSGEKVTRYVYGTGDFIDIEDSIILDPLTYHSGENAMSMAGPVLVATSSKSITLATYNKDKQTPLNAQQSSYEKAGEKTITFD